MSQCHHPMHWPLRQCLARDGRCADHRWWRAEGS